MTQAPLLEDRVLSGKPFQAFSHRLRFFWYTFPLLQSVHALELYGASEILGKRQVFTFALIQSLAEGVISFLWGGLESQRAWSRQNPDEAKTQALWVRWQSFSIFLGALLGILTLGFALTAWLTWEDGAVIASYSAAISFRFFFELPLQVWQSKIFARRRVYRPFYWVIAVPLVQALALVLIWGWNPILAFSVSQLIAVLLRVGISIRFYGLAEKFPIQANYRSFLRMRYRELFPEAFPQFKIFLSLAIAYSAARVGLPSLVALSGWLARDLKWVSFSFAIFIAAPALRASGSWSQFFHFDFARLTDGPWTKLRTRFFNEGRPWSLLHSLYTWGWACLWILIFTQKDYSRPGAGLGIGLQDAFGAAVFLLPLCLIQGVLAWSVLENFTARRGGRALFVLAFSASVLCLPLFVPALTAPPFILAVVLLHRLIPWTLLSILPYQTPQAALQTGRLSWSEYEATPSPNRIRFTLSSRLRSEIDKNEIDQRLGRILPGDWSKDPMGIYEASFASPSEERAALHSLAGVLGSWHRVKNPVENRLETKPENQIETLRSEVPKDAWMISTSGPVKPTELVEFQIWENTFSLSERHSLFRAVERDDSKKIKLKGWNIYPLKHSGEVQALIGIPRRPRTQSEQVELTKFLTGLDSHSLKL